MEGALEGLEAVGVNVRNEEELDVKRKGKGKERRSSGWRDLEDAGVEEDERVWLHCSVGDVMEDDEIEGEKIQVRSLHHPLSVLICLVINTPILTISRRPKSPLCKALTG